MRPLSELQAAVQFFGVEPAERMHMKQLFLLLLLMMMVVMMMMVFVVVPYDLVVRPFEPPCTDAGVSVEAPPTCRWAKKGIDNPSVDR